MENTIEDKKIRITEIKKELYKTKVNAKFDFFFKPNLYYTIALLDGMYQFPIPLSEKRTLTLMDGDETIAIFDIEKPTKDIFGARFDNEIKASELNRWIERAIKNNEFIKIN